MTRDKRISFQVEEPLEDTYRKLCDKRGISVSSALRKHMIEDMRAAGVLPDKFLVDVLVGA